MITTTKDIKIKDTKPEKLKMLTSNKVQPKEFEPKGKPNPKSEEIITTHNVEKFQKKRKKK